MSGNESVAEEVYEAGLELVNPGGRPEVLEAAAKGWRTLASEVDEMFSALDREVKGTVGGSWRGDAAEAFRGHWNELKSAVDQITPQFEDAAKGLDDAAKAIREVNDEIHDIYVEIGISIGVSVGMSFLTMGFSAAAGAARAAQLAARAVEAAGRLGQLLRRVAVIFRMMYANAYGKVVLQGIANFAGGSAGGMATSYLSGKGFEVKTNLVGGAMGATAGTAVGKGAEALMGSRAGATFVSGAAGGAAGGFSGDYANALREGKDFDVAAAGITAVTGGVAGGGAASSVGMHSAFSPGITQGQEFTVDVGVNSTVPVPGGVPANDAKDGLPTERAASAEAESAAKKGSDKLDSSRTDNVRDVFG